MIVCVCPPQISISTQSRVARRATSPARARAIRRSRYSSTYFIAVGELTAERRQGVAATSERSVSCLHFSFVWTQLAVIRVTRTSDVVGIGVKILGHGDALGSPRLTFLPARAPA